MYDLIWILLLPVAAAAGWWAHKRSAARECEKRGPITNPAYFRGLNYLVNEEPDKAIDVFVQLLEVDTETIETHLALGSLFRRRGEVERAIRIHQNLIARPALSREQRAQALLELGKDYMRAGLYDRAENLFLELKEMKLHLRPALENLRTIYQQEKEWDAALKVADELEPLVTESLGLEKAHYYCELADEARQAGKYDAASNLLKKAISANNVCVRPNHMQAQIAMDREDCKSAIKLLHKAADKDPDYLPEILPEIVACYQRLGDVGALSQYLATLSDSSSYVGVALSRTDLIRQTEGEEQALAFLSSHIQDHPSLRALLRLIELNTNLPDVEAGEMLFKIRGHLQRLLAERPSYQCTKCGFVANMLHWHCPSCQSWSTIRRKPELEDQQE